MCDKGGGRKLVCICRYVDEDQGSQERAQEPSTSRGHGRSCRPGILTRNPFLNYCRYIRENNCGLSAVQVVQRAAREWKTMSKEEKEKFRSDCTGGRKSRNPFFNFIREKRGEVCVKSQTDLVKRAAEEWNKMNEAEKMKYRDVAKKVPRKKGLKRRRSRERRMAKKARK
jgi:hypothetical protein